MIFQAVVLLAVLFGLWILLLFRAVARNNPLFHCERCEQKTAERFDSMIATVIACGDHEHCGFRRCLRDELYPENVRVLYDPGPGKERQRS